MIYIRGDGNARIGAGHLMRCITIAEELARLQGGREKICFVCADEASGALVQENGFRCYVLGTDYRDMESELPLWRELWEKRRQEKDSDRDSSITGSFDGDSDMADGSDTDRVIVDSYYVTDFYLEALGETAYMVLMDDMGERCYPVDCVINYNAPASIETYRKLYEGSATKLLIGSRYTPLRRQFRRAEESSAKGIGGLSDGSRGPVLRQSGEPEEILAEDIEGLSAMSCKSFRRQFRETGREKNTREEDSGNTEAGTGGAGKAERNAVREVLITAGGGDIGNIVVEILKRIYRDNFLFHIVTGRFHPDFQRMRELEKAYHNIHIHYDVKDMAGLMRRCQIALTAGGSTVYELAALGVPFICFSCAENQEALVDHIGSRQIAGSAGAWHREPEQTLERIERLFAELSEEPKLREAFRIREMALADGKGAQRLAEALMQPDCPGTGLRYD